MISCEILDRNINVKKEKIKLFKRMDGLFRKIEKLNSQKYMRSCEILDRTLVWSNGSFLVRQLDKTLACRRSLFTCCSRNILGLLACRIEHICYA